MKEVVYTLDLRQLLSEYILIPELQPMYSVVRLSTILSVILTVPGNLDDEEYLWQSLSSSIESFPEIFTDNFMTNYLPFFIDKLKYDVDRELIKQSPDGVDPGESYFLQWIDTTTVLMRSQVCYQQMDLISIFRTYQYR